MNNSVGNTGRLVWAALRMLLVLTAVTGVAYPLAVTGVAQGLFHDRANGSIVRAEGRDVGSALIGQTWNIEGTGEPDPVWFQPRPSNSDYDPLATGSGQLGASDATLTRTVGETRRAVAAFNGVPVSEVPKDAVTGSASAIDPHISPAYADLQVKRVARANGLTARQVAALVDRHTEGRTAGFLGQPHVNVLRLNLALKDLAAG
ncbi:MULTISPECIES: potassium-transporting ATPase subunit KdpC [unclassified Streptomyces]|uniref:potassium-transporting ATPase subunit KdpC n=1 Tax=unclassified Streptomyces TaxID=2593676 RepID=UPI00331CE28C